MEHEEFGEIREREVSEAVESGKVIETYPEDEPRSCIKFGVSIHHTFTRGRMAVRSMLPSG
jgi:hypothetical protein